MKQRLIISAISLGGALAFALVARPAMAQTANTSVAASNSESGSASQSGAVAASNQEQAQMTQQGNAQNITFNTQPQRKVEVMANSNVPIAAAVSFSSDYCGGTASGGISTSLGFSVGAGKPVQDNTCQALRRSEKFSITAATARNLGDEPLAGYLMGQAAVELCVAQQLAQHVPIADAYTRCNEANASRATAAAAAAAARAVEPAPATSTPVIQPIPQNDPPVLGALIPH